MKIPLGIKSTNLNKKINKMTDETFTTPSNDEMDRALFKAMKTVDKEHEEEVYNQVKINEEKERMENLPSSIHKRKIEKLKLENEQIDKSIESIKVQQKVKTERMQEDIGAEIKTLQDSIKTSTKLLSEAQERRSRSEAGIKAHYETEINKLESMKEANEAALSILS